MLGDLGKLIVAKGFKRLPKVQKIARSGHTGQHQLIFVPFKRLKIGDFGVAVVVAQLVERLLPTLEVHGSQPVIGKKIY